MADTNDTKDFNREEWEARRDQAWREAWIALINKMDASYLNGLFITVSQGEGSVFPAIIPFYGLEEILGYREDTRKSWDASNDEQKSELLELVDNSITEAELLSLDDKFTECMKNDEKLSELEELETEEVEDLDED